MGVVADDFNGDGHIDFYVANDADDNLLWQNNGRGRFTDTALLAGAAVNGHGIAEASMGVAAADFDDDGDIDLFMTHDVNESNTLFVNDGRGWFEDRSSAAGVASGSVAYVGFGTAWLDADNDGDLDLFAANGSVRFLEGQLADGITRRCGSAISFGCMRTDAIGRPTADPRSRWSTPAAAPPLVIWTTTVTLTSLWPTTTPGPAFTATIQAARHGLVWQRAILPARSLRQPCGSMCRVLADAGCERMAAMRRRTTRASCSAWPTGAGPHSCR